MSENQNLTVIRRARPEDMEEILQMVGDIFELEQGIDRKYNPIPECNLPKWWCMEKDNRIIGAIAAWVEENGIQMGRFAIHPDYRGQHLGTALLKTAISAVFEQGVEFIRGGARDTTMHILTPLGAKVNGETVVFFGSNITPFILYREDYEQALQANSCCGKKCSEGKDRSCCDKKCSEGEEGACCDKTEGCEAGECSEDKTGSCCGCNK